MESQPALQQSRLSRSQYTGGPTRRKADHLAGQAVWSRPRARAAAGRGTDLDLRHLEGAERRSLLRAAADAGAGDLDVQPEVCTGQPSAVLTALARPQDVLVTGSRGRGGFLGLLLGSTSTQCAQHATCPIVVVHEAARGLRAP